MNLKEEMRDLIIEFEQYIDKENEERGNQAAEWGEAYFIEPDYKFTFNNFYKWLKGEI